MSAFQLLFFPSLPPPSRGPLSRGPVVRIPHFCFLLSTFLLFIALSLFETASAQTIVTPAQWLASQPYPNFAPGCRLPPLTKDGWSLSSNLNVVSAQYFGYALDLGEIAPSYGTLQAMTNPGTFEYGMVQLAAAGSIGPAGLSGELARVV